MQSFLLPYAVAGLPIARKFWRIRAASIQLAADAACREIREVLRIQTGKEANVIVGEVDYTKSEASTKRRNNAAKGAVPPRNVNFNWRGNNKRY